MSIKAFGRKFPFLSSCVSLPSRRTQNKCLRKYFINLETDKMETGEVAEENS